MKLTKSDYLLFREAPLHLWAQKHDKFTIQAPSPYDQHLMKQGYEVEHLAKECMQKRATKPEHFLWQRRYIDGSYETKTDALIFDPVESVYDLYEIKSSNSVKNDHLYDATFQALILESQLTLRHVYIVSLNEEYIFQSELDLSQLFSITCVDEEVSKLKNEVQDARTIALNLCEKEFHPSIEACVKPKLCPCRDLCHPQLPEYSIYNIARLAKDKALELRNEGIFDIRKVPKDFKLSDKQRLQVQVAQSGIAHIEYQEIAHELNQLVFPLYFLDYETYSSAIPLYNGYKPNQHMVFQYSVHILDANQQEPTHAEFVNDQIQDPSYDTVSDMKRKISRTGSIIVWNKTFEASRNTEMAERYPEHRDFLLDLNARIYDLMEIFNSGM